MLTLKPGIQLDLAPGRARLRRIASGFILNVPLARLQEVERIALGEIPALVEASDYVRELVADDWITDDQDTLDPLVRDAIARLDARFAWAGGVGREPYARVLSLHARRRRVQRSLGQYPALPETVCRRAQLAGPAPADILVLGDDDLLSLALAMLGHRVTVVDADPYLVRFLGLQAERLGLTLDARRWDFRQPMAADLVDRFDMVFTDPMSSAACLSLFVDRALAGLKPGGVTWVCVNEPATRVFDQHRRATRAGLVTHHTDFNHYYTGALALAAYVSDLYGLKKLPPTHPTLAPDAGFYGTGLYNELHYGARQASRFVIRDIDPTFTELSHVRNVVEEVKQLGNIRVDDELYHWDESYRTYLALLEGGRVVAITVKPKQQLCEMVTAPPEDYIERAFQAALLAVYGKPDSGQLVTRVRSSLASFLP